MVDINLLPQKERASTKPNLWGLASWVWLPIALAATLIPYALTQGKANQVQRQIDDTQRQIDALTSQKQEYDALVQQRTTLQQVTNVAQTLRSQKTYWSNDLAAFNRQLPQDSTVYVTSLKMSSVPASELSQNQNAGIYVGKQVSRKVELSGQATSQQAVINLLNAFEKNPNFGVNFKSLQQQKADVNNPTAGYTFSADVGVVGTPSEAAQQAQQSGAATPSTGAATPAGTPAPAAPTAPAAPAGGTN